MFIRPLKLTQHVDVQGPENATTVVLLHSLGTDLHLWDLQMPRLSERYRVVRLDIRGHGLSAVDALRFSMSDLADDVVAALDHLQINAFYVAGVSIGGTIAQWIGFKIPKRVQGMIIVDTALVNAAPPSLWRARAEDVFHHGVEHLEMGILSKWVTPKFLDSPYADGMKQMLRRTTVEAFAGCSYAIADTDLTDMNIPGVPTLAAEFNSLPFERGTVGMARSRHPHSASHQFFITSARAGYLDQNYTAFGKVTHGIDLIDQLRQGAPETGSVVNPDVIKSMRLATVRAAKYNPTA